MEEFLAREFPALAGDGRLRVRTRRELPGALASGRHHCFHLSDCIHNPAHLARLRNALAPARFPITAPTHSLSYTRYMRDLLAHLWPGVTPRDCVVATSRGAVGVLGALYDHLDGCYGPLPRPRVERIPLGVDTEARCPPDPAQRAAARDRLGLDEDHCALLVFARISQYSKLALVPVLRAARRLAAGGVDLARLRLFVAGWTDAGDPYPATLAALAANAGLRLEVVSRPGEAAKRDLFHAADVFLSPVDNPQETFGLTVLEAAAFGLPAVVSDYDGYRDLVQDGSTGLLVPTLGPGPTPDVDALAPLVFDNQSHLLLAQQTVVDVPALARALARLVPSRSCAGPWAGPPASACSRSSPGLRWSGAMWSCGTRCGPSRWTRPPCAGGPTRCTCPTARPARAIPRRAGTTPWPCAGRARAKPSIAGRISLPSAPGWKGWWTRSMCPGGCFSRATPWGPEPWRPRSPPGAGWTPGRRVSWCFGP